MALRTIDIAGLSLFLALAAHAPVHADTMTQVVDLGLISTNNTTDWVFDQFDPALGTLESVSIEFEGRFLNGFRFGNLGSATSVQMGFTEQATIQGPNSELIYTSPVLSGAVTRTIPPIVPLPPSHTPMPRHRRMVKPQNFSGSYTWDQTAELDSFIGTGTLNIPFLTSATHTAEVDGNGRAAGGSKVRTVAELTYTYTPATPVPEPGIYLMLIVGLSATWLRFRNKAC